MPTNLRTMLSLSLLAELMLAASLCAQDPETNPFETRGPDGFLFRAPRVTLGLRAGFNVQRAGSGIYDFVTDQLTLDRSDFNAFNVGADLGFTLTGPVDLVLGAGYSRTTNLSEFRNYVDQDDLPISQRTTFTTTPLTAAARVYLTSRGRQIGRFVWIPARFMPYVGAGGGMVYYLFKQVGSFVDVDDLSIFDDNLQSDGWTPLGLVMAGADYGLGTRVFLNADVRYLWANGELREDFLQFADGINLSGLQMSVGVKFRL